MAHGIDGFSAGAGMHGFSALPGESCAPVLRWVQGFSEHQMLHPRLWRGRLGGEGGEGGRAHPARTKRHMALGRTISSSPA